jgi:glycosyltransferase involved in cell wall biosynthesis
MEPDPEVLRRLGIGNDDIVVVSACRLVGWKGIQYAIKAVARLMREGHAITYVIIGDGEQKPELQALAKTLGVESRILFPGGQNNSELPRYYSVATVAVFPSIGIETFGIAIAEAMSCGVPVISTAVGGIPEVVAGGTGLLVQPRDEEALASALENLLIDRSLREKMGAEGRRRITENFSWDVIVERFGRYIADA